MSLMQEIAECPWFLPKATLVQEEVNELVKQHQKCLQPFGLKDVLPCSFIKIWPGGNPQELARVHQLTRQSVHRMIIENLLGIMREVAVSSGMMPALNRSLREMSAIVKANAREAAIQVAGLTVKATITMQAVNLDPQVKASEIDDFEIVERAVEDAVENSGWHLSWLTIEKQLAMEKKKNYSSPFAPLFNLWKLGTWPLGIYEGNYVILVPGGRRVRIVTPSIR